MWDFDQPFFQDKLIRAELAWERLEAWREAGCEIGVWFVAQSGSVRALGTVEAAGNGRVEIRAPRAGANWNLQEARFTFGPFQLFPRWPMGPMVEVMALSAYLPDGGWLVMAEGVKALGPVSLPA
jgi:hypothetical protein